MALKRVTPPEPLIPIPLARQHLRVDHDDDNGLIALYLEAAIAHIEGPDGMGDGLCLMPQEWELVIAAPTCRRPVVIPLGPLLSVESVTLAGAAGDVPVSADAYEVDADSIPGAITPLETWPAAGRGQKLRIRFVAGYRQAEGGAVTVPAPLRSAVLMLLADLYQHRETIGTSMVSLPVVASARALVDPFRVNWSF